MIVNYILMTATLIFVLGGFINLALYLTQDDEGFPGQA